MEAYKYAALIGDRKHEWDELHKKNLEAKPWLKKH
jgi:hypothetical protein